ncbi:hypothetical protein M902_1082 [Bacteriovorax sp. BAL6_X]|uniref:hypothetical protein n=1 Tax=Bacteriovorax sp. BAL6_X TaxID=1201290 RepID=UPI000385B32C|nr:hypothetical protein [Bacteriovorax sp. BAL6_X]EPZ49913.1 hypothetical protein M902_1082 [Bacteriovorax sp. BAL6_X]
MCKSIFLLFILNLSVWSADLHLFNADESFNDNFAQSILSGDLKANEVIHLKDKNVIFKEILGSGNTTIILKVYDEELQRELALRLPHGNQEKRYTIFDGKKFIDYSYQGFEELDESKLSIPKIHDYEKSAYLLVDLIENDYDLKEYLSKSSSMTNIEKTEVEDALIDFAKKSAIYQSIGDFHSEQIVYSKALKKWYLLDWSSGHTLARLPSSPTLFSDHFFTNSERSTTEYERDLMNRLNEAVSEQRAKQVELDNIELEKIKQKLSEIADYKKIIEVYSELRTNHMMSFYTQLQKDFITNHLTKFPAGEIKKQELELLMNHLGKFSPFYFSQFAEKVMANIYDLESFMFIYNKMNEIGLDEELEDDISDIIANHIKRIISNTIDSPQTSKDIEKLLQSYGLIGYLSKQVLENASEYLRPAQSCQEVLSNILNS